MGWGLRLRTLLTGVMILLACQVGEVLAAAQIKSVRIWRAPDNTRLSISRVRCSTACSPWPHPTVSSSTSAAPSWRPSSTVSSSATPRSPRCARPAHAQRPAHGPRPVGAGHPEKLRPTAQPAIRQPPGGRSLRPGADLTPDVPATPTPSVPVTPVTPTQPVAKLPLPTKGGTRDIVIAIDAGHGGEDPGALGRAGCTRRTSPCRSLASCNARSTRCALPGRADPYRRLFHPAAQAHRDRPKKGADLFVSIHADAAPSRSAFGASVFALSDRGATSETARWLADSENRSDLIGGDGSVSLGDKTRCSPACCSTCR